MERMTISEYFEADRSRLEDLFTTFQRYKNTDFFRAREYFAAFKFGLQRHIVWEEEVLFPLFERNTGMIGSGPTCSLKREHRKIAQILKSLYKKLQRLKQDTEIEERALSVMLKIHNEKGENVIYPAIDGVATSREIDGVFEAMRNIPEERYSDKRARVFYDA